MNLSPRMIGALAGLVILVGGFAIYSGRNRSITPATSPAANIEARSSPIKRWEVSFGSGPLTGAAIGLAGAIYVGGPNVLLAVSDEGRLLWKYPVLQGLLAPPVVAPDGAIFVASIWGKLESVSSDGAQRWDSQYQLIGFEGSPVFHNRMLYAANTVSHLWALDLNRRPAEAWHFETERDDGLVPLIPPGRILPGTARVEQVRSEASPILGPDGNLYLPRQSWLHSFSPDGVERWRTHLTAGMLGTAAMGQNGTIYVAGRSGHNAKLFAVSLDGAILWQLDLAKWVLGSPVVDMHGDVYVSSFDRLIAVTAAGAVKWDFRPPRGCDSSPALAQDGTLYLGADSGRFIAVNSDGSLKWGMSTKGTVRQPPVIADNGTIYLTTDTGRVIALMDSGSPLMRNAWPRYQHDSQNTGIVPRL